MLLVLHGLWPWFARECFSRLQLAFIVASPSVFFVNFAVVAWFSPLSPVHKQLTAQWSAGAEGATVPGKNSRCVSASSPGQSNATHTTPSATRHPTPEPNTGAQHRARPATNVVMSQCGSKLYKEDTCEGEVCSSGFCVAELLCVCVWFVPIWVHLQSSQQSHPQVTLFKRLLSLLRCWWLKGQCNLNVQTTFAFLLISKLWNNVCPHLSGRRKQTRYRLPGKRRMLAQVECMSKNQLRRRNTPIEREKSSQLQA